MTEKITGIVLDLIRHNDRYNVVTLYTRGHGRMAFLSPAGSGKSARMRNARLQPLSVVSSDVNISPARQLPLLGSAAPEVIWRDIYFNPVKSSIALFLTEFINRYLRDSSPDPQTWDFTFGAISNLDIRKESPANFHIAFLIRFLTFAGICPDMSDYEPGDFLDMQAGGPVAGRPVRNRFLSPEETAVVPLLLRMTFRNCHRFRFTGVQRRVVLQKILQYYSVHFPWITGLHSLDVLSEVFG